MRKQWTVECFLDSLFSVWNVILLFLIWNSFIELINQCKVRTKMTINLLLSDEKIKVTNLYLFRNLSKRWDESNNIKLTSLLKRNNRKQAAQKFYSLLVLQKVVFTMVWLEYKGFKGYFMFWTKVETKSFCN